MKKCYFSIIAALLSTAPLISGEMESKPTSTLIAKEAALSEELVTLSEWLEKLQIGIKEEGIETIWVGGGAARATLDHLYFGKPLTMRDLDVFAIANRQATREFVEHIGEKLEAEDFGFYSRQDLRSRPRVPNDKPILIRNDYEAGYGLYWLRPNGEILDLSVYHTKADLDLNGIYDIDTIMIPLNVGETLLDFARKAMQVPYDELVAGGQVYDRYGGYAQWQKGDVKIVNWLAIESDPLWNLSRVVRTLNKMGRYEFTDEERLNLLALMERAQIKNPLQLTRGLLKLLEDDNFASELKLLSSVDGFKIWLTPLKELIASDKFAEIATEMSKAEELAYGREDRLGMARLRILLNHIPDENQRLSAIAEVLAPFDLDSAALWMFDELFKMETEFKKLDLDKKAFETKIVKIASSTVLSPDMKKRLFLRAFVQGQERAEAEKQLRALFPELDSALIESVAAESQTLRRGIVTGIFNPVHLGHVEMIQEAITEMALDEIYIVPTKEIGPFENPIDWEDRYAMLSLALADIPEAKLIPIEYKHRVKEGYESALSLFMNEQKLTSESEWIRLIGSDMLTSLGSKGDIESLRPSHYQKILVIQRGQDPFYPIEGELKERFLFKSHALSDDSHQTRHLAKKVRKIASEGGDLTEVVPKAVAEYIYKNKLFSKESQKAPLTLVSTNDRKLAKAKKILGNVQKIEVDIPLFQDPSPDAVVRKKLSRAMELGLDNVMVIEHFIKIKALSSKYMAITDQTLQQFDLDNLEELLTQKTDEAVFLSIVGYSENGINTKLYTGSVKGKIDPKILKETSFDIERAFYSDEAGPSALQQALEKLKSEQFEGASPLLASYQTLFDTSAPDDFAKVVNELSLEAQTLETFKQIEKSQVLTLEEKRVKFLSRLFRQLSPEQRALLFPHFESAYPTLLKECDQPEIGFLTGVFNPIHNGHLESVKRAMQELVLDQAILIPTIATSHNEKPIAWQTRLQLARLAVSAEPHISIISEEYETALLESTGAALKKLQNAHPNTKWFHLMGSDSFERFQEQGRLESAQWPVVILQRAGSEVSLPPSEKTRLYEVKTPSDIGAKERASSTIRALIESGKPIDHLVPQSVKAEIQRQGLYTSAN